MRLHKDGRTIDVQPKRAGRLIDAGWSTTPPKPSRRTRQEPKPATEAGPDISDDKE